MHHGIIKRERNNRLGNLRDNKRQKLSFQASRRNTLKKVRRLGGAGDEDVVTDEEVYGYDGPRTPEYVSTLHLKLLERVRAQGTLDVDKGFNGHQTTLALRMYYACVFGDVKPDDTFNVARSDNPVDWTVFCTAPNEVKCYIKTICGALGDHLDLLGDSPPRGAQPIESLPGREDYWAWLYGSEPFETWEPSPSRKSVDMEEVVALGTDLRLLARGLQPEVEEYVGSEDENDLEDGSGGAANLDGLVALAQSVVFNIKHDQSNSRAVLLAEQQRALSEGPSSTPKGIEGGWLSKSLSASQSSVTQPKRERGDAEETKEQEAAVKKPKTSDSRQSQASNETLPRNLHSIESEQ